MTGLQTFLSGKRGRKPRGLPVATLVCLVLLALMAVVQVAHVHQVDTDGDHCPLCIAMHSATPVAVAAAVVILEQVENPAPVFEAHSVTRPWHPTLFTRPPPDGSRG